ncbi:Uncharacterised protein [Starkeya nomas]|uniref:DUF3035 domain-containing protein n=1 Tax=Starkeya nomas TaxID=2666134 RepID=A0A5S9Q1D4_9HYPH|nr:MULTISPECIES: hypothetical protein [Xanthobacteraceae]CAA0110875.1 Uncharacterised protein [Starkeya nomas]
MMRRHLATRTRLLAGTALFGALLAGAPAYAQEDSDLNLTGKLLTAIGLVAPPPPDIDYRERAPLVVPPSGDALPPPRDAGAMAQNPAWPKDHDTVARQKAIAAEPVMRDETDTAHRALSPSQLERGAKIGGASGSGFANRRKNDDNRLSLNQLEFFGWTKKEEKMEFEGEPDRELLTQPPVGYQTPAPGAAYGVVADRPEEKQWSLPSWFDRTQSNK